MANHKIYSAMEIAAYLVKRAKDFGIDDMSPLKVIKLAYISHGKSLGKRGVPLFSEQVEAWRYGPVIPVIYDSLKHHGKSPVPEIPITTNIDAESKKIMDGVLEAYGKLFSAVELINITHGKDSPWDEVTRGGTVYGRGHVIPNSDIQSHYESMA